MQAERIVAIGLATPRPAMSGAEPCTGSNTAWWSPTFADGARPRPPTRPAMRSERMSPNRLVVTSTSNASGSRTSFMAQASTMIS
jgi:hypothetical protein